MVLNALNQNTTGLKLGSFMSSTLNSYSGNKNNSNSYYAKKGEPMYQEDMDSDRDGIVTFDEFKDYCKVNNISSKDMTDMMEMRMAYRMSQIAERTAYSTSEKNKSVNNLDLIYANDGDTKYDSELDINDDSKISYTEYLRYCAQNARMEAKNSDTKIVENNKKQFMTVSYGHASNAYNKVESETPEGKIESKA